MANSASPVRFRAREQRTYDGKASSHSLFARPQSHRNLGSTEGIVQRKGMSDADVDGDEDATRAGRRERDRPASYSQKIVQLLSKGGTRAGACKFLSAALGRPRNLGQKLIAVVGTGIISHPQPSNSGHPLTHLVYPPARLITVNYARYHSFATAIITTAAWHTWDGPPSNGQSRRRLGEHDLDLAGRAGSRSHLIPLYHGDASALDQNRPPK
ncbi:hypothetical protein LA080_006866 [Diaporthe eres]|nr:hypothetical protein LA080_006866 [Diaporthe eres]